MAVKTQRARSAALLALVLSTVVIQIVVALLLKELADANPGTLDVPTLLVLAGVAGLNGARFLVWGYTHKFFPLSHSYPLTALFFPCILALSVWYGDSIGWRNIVGVAIIMLGIGLMSSGREDAA